MTRRARSRTGTSRWSLCTTPAIASSACAHEDGKRARLARSAEPRDPLDEQLEEALGVDVNCDVAALAPTRRLLQVHIRAPARGLGTGVHPDRAVTHLEQAPVDDVRERDRVVDRRS